MADIEKDEEYYLRAILLLLKGCRYIALEALLRAVRDKKKDSGKDLDDVLKNAEEKLNSKFDSNQRKKLFPDGDAKALPDTWDISLITGLILNCYKSSLKPWELQAVKTIKYNRNTVLGHSSVASLSYEDYDNVCRELENAIEKLSSTFNVSVQEKCKELVTQSLTGALQTAKEDIKMVTDYDNFCKVLLKKIQELEQLNRDLRTEIEQLLEEKRDRVFSTMQVVDTEIVIGGPGNDTDTRDMAEQILTVVIEEAKRREGSDAARNEIRSAVDDILKEIQQLGMNVGSVERKCILLRVQCTSYDQVLRLMEFTVEAKFQNLLRKLAEALTRHIGLSQPLELAFRISKKSVVGLLAGLRDENAQGTKSSLSVVGLGHLEKRQGDEYAQGKRLSLPVRYKSVAELAHLWRFFEEGKGTSKVERLSMALSKYLGKDISIKLSLNPEQVLKALQNTDITAMAVGGLGAKLFSESVYISSAADLSYCKMCLDVQKVTEASKYCLHCHENFCEVCLNKHKESESKAKPIGHIDMAQSGSSTQSKSRKLTDKSTQKCESCKKENVEYFCQEHAILACGPCLEQNHKNCSIDWIQTKAVGVAGHIELRETNYKILDQVVKTDKIQELASTINEGNEESLNREKLKVEEYYLNILKRLEHMKKETIVDAENTQRMHSKRIREVNDKSTEYHNELVKLKEKIKLKVEKGKEADAYALMKKAKMVLQSLESFNKEKQNILQTVTYTFEPDRTVEELFSDRCKFGKITDGYKLENLARSLHEKKMEVSTETDERKCSITGCAIMNDDRLLLVDSNNSKLKILDKHQRAIVDEFSLHGSSCFDIVVLPDNQAAVTQPEEESIVFVKTYGRMEVVKNVNINQKCYGVTYSEKCERIYTVCGNPCCVISIDLNGDIHQEIALSGTKESSFSMPQYISVDSNNQFLYVSENSFVARVSLDGKLEKVCKTDELIDLSGLTVLEDNTVLVCSKKSRCVFKISADMDNVKMLGTGIPDAQTVCCFKKSRQIFVGSSDSYVARILDMP